MALEQREVPGNRVAAVLAVVQRVDGAVAAQQRGGVVAVETVHQRVPDSRGGDVRREEVRERRGDVAVQEVLRVRVGGVPGALLARRAGGRGGDGTRGYARDDGPEAEPAEVRGGL